MKNLPHRPKGFLLTSVLSGIALLGLGYIVYDAHTSGGGMVGSMMGMMSGNERHRLVMKNGLPEPYTDTVSLFTSTPENVTKGKDLFGVNCVSCHGDTGRGDGIAAKTLNPAPADLVSSLSKPIASDAFLYWTISEGGAPVKSAMPPFKSIFSEKEKWQIIQYLRQMD